MNKNKQDAEQINKVVETICPNCLGVDGCMCSLISKTNSHVGKISDQFSFKISPTMESIINMQGDVTLEIDDKEYRLIREDKLDNLLIKTRQEAVEEAMDNLKRDVYRLPKAGTLTFSNGEEIDMVTKYQVASAINCYPHTLLEDELKALSLKKEL
jgi:hypothetical protein